MPNRMKRLLSLALVIGLAIPPRASAWGERGHDLITRVAVRLLAAKIAPGVAWSDLTRWDAEVEFISVEGELKECVLWFGPLRTAAFRASFSSPVNSTN